MTIMKTIVLVISLVVFATGIWFGYDSYYPVREFDRHIVINTDRNELFLFDRLQLVGKYEVSTGKEDDMTPRGRFLIANKIEDIGGQFGTRWMGLDVPGHKRGQKYGIHGTDEPELIGKHVSAGCIRMRNKEVEQLFQKVVIGTPVYIR